VGEELIDQLNDYELLKKDHAPRSKLVNWKSPLQTYL
jgi:hypothetical protein